jgi:Flp pilus assembly protein TadD
LWPVDLAVFYPYNTDLPAWQVVGALGLLVAITAGVLALARHQPYLPVGWFWFLGTLFPVIGLFQAGSQSMCDHYSYISIIGLFLMLAWALPARTVSVAAGCAVLVACGLVTRRHLGHWEHSEKLFRHALAVTTDNAGARQNLGEALEAQGRDAEAAAEYQAALKLDFSNAEVHFNLANTLTRLNRPSAALRHYQFALRLQPGYAKAHVNLANLLLQAGRLDPAIQHYRTALAVNADLAEAHNNLGLALVAKGDLATAIRHYEAARRLWPDSDGVRQNLASARAQLSNHPAGHEAR